jgi:hypothetical protein
MVTYMPIPQFKLTLGTTPFENDIMISAKVTRNENNFDLATIVLADTNLYPGTVTDGTAVQLDVKDASDSSYTTIFKGVVRFLVPDISKDGRTLTLSCFGSGYGLGEMLVGNEYGTQSIHPSIDTPTEIVTDIINNYVKKILAGANSGFNYTVLTTIANSIPYINFPYKTANASLNDLVDLVTAQEAGDPGIHWIVTTDNVLHMKFISATQTGWDQYYGGSPAAATLTYGKDYFNINLEKMAPEANYVIYYGNWRRPSNGDTYTNVGCDSIWTAYNYGSQLSEDTTNYIINTSSLKCNCGVQGGSTVGCYLPSTHAAWDFSGFSNDNVPTMNLYLRRSGTITGMTVSLYNLDGSENIIGYGTTDLTSQLANASQFYHFTLPLGKYYNTPSQFQDFKWYGSPALDWSRIDKVMFYFTGGENVYINIDGFYVGDANLCRVAWNSSLPGGTAKMKLITDAIGKDDVLKSGTPGVTDQGLMAQLAYASLLQLQKEALVGTADIPTIIKDALPGQLFSIQGTDFRATKIVHNLQTDGFTSVISITDDVTNGRARARYEDVNKIYAAIRPEFQDRASSSIKAGTVDWKITRLVEDYA